MADRSARDERRRALAQNFLRDRRLALELASRAHPGELVVEFGAGRGDLTVQLARRGARVIAIESDPVWAERLTHRLRVLGLEKAVHLLVADMFEVTLPAAHYRVIASPPFNRVTALLHRLLDEPSTGPTSADLIVQSEVALKRSAAPPRTLISTAWAPWWLFRVVRRIPRESFRPIPRTNAAWLSIVKRDPPVLPHSMAPEFAEFVRSRWDAWT